MPRNAYETRVVIDMETGTVLERITVPYDGPWAECKGGLNAQRERENKQQDMFNSLLKEQLAITNPTLKQIIANGGMLPQQEAAMNSLAMNTLPKAYQDLYGSLSNSLVARGVTGGQNAGGGEIARQFGALGAEEASQQANLLSAIQVQKGNQLQSALGLGQNPISPFIGGGSSAGSTATQAAQAQAQASSGLWGSLFGALASPFSISR